MARAKKRLSERLQAATKSRKEPAPTPLRLPDEDDLPVELAAFVGAVATGLVIIMVLAIFYGTQNIERTVESQTLGLLRANGIRDVDVNVDGLDVVLVGTVRDEAQIPLALAIADSIEGVRSIDYQNLIFVPLPPDVEVELVADPLVVSWNGEGAVVSGTVSDEATRDVIIAAVAETWASVDATGLVVKEGLDPERDWLPSILRVVARAGEDLPEGAVIANAPSAFVLVNGELETRSEQLAVRTDVQDILSALTFEFTSGLTIKEQPPPPTRAPSPGSTPAPTTTTTVPPEVIELQETLDELIEGKVVEFDFASALITPEGRTLLDEVLEALRKFPDVPVEIGGHTDDVGTEETNLLLSRLRAASVLSYLIEHGENASRFVVIGYGESQPIADNATAEGRARNRRIEFTALSE